MKPSTAKRKGAKTEQLFVDWLRTNGFPDAERRHLAGKDDLGDVAGVPGWVFEVKSGGRLAISEWLKEVKVEMKNADDVFPGKDHLGAVVVRPPNKPNPDDWYVIMSPDVLLALIEKWERVK